MRTILFSDYLRCNFIGAGTAFVLAASALTATAQDLLPLNKEKQINSSLLSAAIGAIIQDKCTTISPRLLLAIWKAKSLQRYALNIGYTQEEIEAFVNSKVEKRRMRRAANSYLRANGVVKNEEATYCAAGRAEIAAGSLTGKLLRSL